MNCEQQMELHFDRPEEWSREQGYLPAQTYNFGQTLLTRSGYNLFVPIRVMGYMAVLDGKEFVFFDRENGQRIEVAWQFPRASLGRQNHPVPYEAVSYSAHAMLTTKQLQEHFYSALQAFAARRQLTEPAKIIPFPGKHS